MPVTIGEVEVLSGPPDAAGHEPPRKDTAQPAPVDEAAVLRMLESLLEQSLRTWSH